MKFQKNLWCCFSQGGWGGVQNQFVILNLFLRKTQVVAVFVLRRTNLSKERVR